MFICYNHLYNIKTEKYYIYDTDTFSLNTMKDYELVEWLGRGVFVSGIRLNNISELERVSNEQIKCDGTYLSALGMHVYMDRNGEQYLWKDGILYRFTFRKSGSAGHLILEAGGEEILEIDNFGLSLANLCMLPLKDSFFITVGYVIIKDNIYFDYFDESNGIPCSLSRFRRMVAVGGM